MPIDLSKLKALELPTKEIDVEILGDVQKVKIICPGDNTAVAVSACYQEQGKDPYLTETIIRLFLTASLPDITPEDIDMIIAKDFKAATVIAAAARDLLQEFITAKKQEKTKAKKK